MGEKEGTEREEAERARELLIGQALGGFHACQGLENPKFPNLLDSAWSGTLSGIPLVRIFSNPPHVSKCPEHRPMWKVLQENKGT